MNSSSQVRVYLGEALAAYHFGAGHPFGPLRHDAFVAELNRRGLSGQVQIAEPVTATRAVIELFHDPAYVDLVFAASASGEGVLDYGDTPAFPGVYEASAAVVGSVIDGVDALMAGACGSAFVPIAGLHHARRDRAGGFCVFNDPAIAIEYLRARHGIRRIAYVDIDAHHGDGVFYAFETDPELFIVDFHESGEYLYPGTGSAQERGRGPAEGTKLNLPLPPGADDAEFFAAWPQAEALLEQARPEFVLLQCGADSLRGDPITDLALSPAVHRHAALRAKAIADRHAGGRLLAMGGGGYDLNNLATAWCEVVAALVEAPR